MKTVLRAFGISLLVWGTAFAYPWVKWDPVTTDERVSHYRVFCEMPEGVVASGVADAEGVATDTFDLETIPNCAVVGQKISVWAVSENADMSLQSAPSNTITLTVEEEPGSVIILEGPKTIIMQFRE